MRDPLVKTWGPDQRRIKLSPISDIHIGNPQFRQDVLDSFLSDVLADPDWYLVGNGDYIENVTRSSVGEVWTQTMTPREQVKHVAKILEPVRSRLLAITDGNHDNPRTEKDTSFRPSELLCDKLGLPEECYQPEGATLVLRFGHVAKENRNTPVVYTGYVNHGRTGGRLPGAKIIAVDRIARTVEGCDFVIMGHVHDLMSRKITVLSLDIHRGYRMIERTQAQVVAGSFLSFGGYAQVYGYQPGAIGMPSLTLDGTRKYLSITM